MDKKVADGIMDRICKGICKYGREQYDAGTHYYDTFIHEEDNEVVAHVEVRSKLVGIAVWVTDNQYVDDDFLMSDPKLFDKARASMKKCIDLAIRFPPPTKPA